MRLDRSLTQLLDGGGEAAAAPAPWKRGDADAHGGWRARMAGSYRRGGRRGLVHRKIQLLHSGSKECFDEETNSVFVDCSFYHENVVIANVQIVLMQR